MILSLGDAHRNCVYMSYSNPLHLSRLSAKTRVHHFGNNPHADCSPPQQNKETEGIISQPKIKYKIDQGRSLRCMILSGNNDLLERHMLHCNTLH